MQSKKDILCLNVPSFIKNKLLEGGYRTVADIEDIEPTRLAQALSISPDEVAGLLRESKGVNAAQEREKGRVVTMNPDLDQLLGGGIAPGQLTEFCGVPGIGKTQLGIQLAVDVQIPKAYHGLEKQCIYIDTEGSFVIERVMDMAQALISHVNDINDMSIPLTYYDLSFLLGNIHYYRVYDYIQQIALVNMLDKILTDNPKIGLVILDSVTFHFRHSFTDMALRARLLQSLANQLTKAAEKHQVAVVLMNQMTTKIQSESSAESSLVPALGDSWGHACTHRVMLYWNDGKRHAHLFKSPSLPSATVTYYVTSEGIR